MRPGSRALPTKSNGGGGGAAGQRAGRRSSPSHSGAPAQAQAQQWCSSAVSSLQGGRTQLCWLAGRPRNRRRRRCTSVVGCRSCAAHTERRCSAHSQRVKSSSEYRSARFCCRSGMLARRSASWPKSRSAYTMPGCSSAGRVGAWRWRETSGSVWPSRSYRQPASWAAASLRHATPARHRRQPPPAPPWPTCRAQDLCKGAHCGRVPPRHVAAALGVPRRRAGGHKQLVVDGAGLQIFVGVDEGRAVGACLPTRSTLPSAITLL